ncbi:MAG: ThuA domain-containing protein [Bacteroidales bacterium]|nr:ThuA domain-containing protein [Bacteroidales bacterium]
MTRLTFYIPDSFSVKIKTIHLFLFISLIMSFNPKIVFGSQSTRVLVVTGGHDYSKNDFNAMLTSLGEGYQFSTVVFPEAFDMFLPENRNQYDVVLFYHMWQTATDFQKQTLADCIASGKPLLVLHHSICAFDDWEEYISIVGGKYFPNNTVLHGKAYAASSYRHDMNIKIEIKDKTHPVTHGINDFELFDETYKDFYVSPSVTSLLTTSEPSSTSVIGWCHSYGQARVVTLQSGHDTPTFEHPVYRRLLGQRLAG